jgi:hypothetical protein
MNEQWLDRVDALAAQLGLVGEHLWGVLILQAYINSGLAILIAVIAGTATWAYFRWVIPWLEEFEFIGVSLGVLVLFVILFAFINLLHNGPCALNPEYCALRMVTQ